MEARERNKLVEVASQIIGLAIEFSGGIQKIEIT